MVTGGSIIGEQIFLWKKWGELPNWSENNHFRPIEISGILEKCKANDKCNTEYIIRKASWGTNK
jgi:oligoribonuclease (3'-5' exoribonuclease)